MILDRDVERGDLRKFKMYLDLVNNDRICFICGQKIQDAELSIDHVIPWSFMYSDDIWNLVYVHKACNSSKSNRIPNDNDIIRLEKRNASLFQLCNSKGYVDKITSELEFAINKNLVRKFWISFK